MTVLQQQRNKGVSLIEVLIATTIFSVAFLSFVSIQIGSLDTVRDGFVKKMITDNGNDFITQLNTDLTSQKNTENKKTVLNYYINEDWNLELSDCPVKGNYLTNCLTNNDLTDKDICTKEERIKMVAHNLQCDVLQNIPSAKIKFDKCNDSSDLHCLLISWNKDNNNYKRCKELDSNCLIFEVLP